MKTNLKEKTLTLKKMEKVFRDLPPMEDMTIKWWQYPFLWALFLIKGRIVGTMEGWKFYWVEFRGISYLLKTYEPKREKERF